ncbi:MAG: glutaredoxin family protein [Dehalococcoidia bacterium]
MPPPVVTLYGRAGCHLCDEALAVLQRLRPRLGFEIAEVDIESDDALLQRYVFAIPVIAVGEHEVARAPVRAEALEDALREALPG